MDNNWQKKRKIKFTWFTHFKRANKKNGINVYQNCNKYSVNNSAKKSLDVIKKKKKKIKIKKFESRKKTKFLGNKRKSITSIGKICMKKNDSESQAKKNSDIYGFKLEDIVVSDYNSYKKLLPIYPFKEEITKTISINKKIIIISGLQVVENPSKYPPYIYDITQMIKIIFQRLNGEDRLCVYL